MSEQLRLFNFHAEDRTSETLLLSESNLAAWKELGRFREWPMGALVLVGPTGSGKSHMALAWAEQSNAGVWRGQGRAMDVFERHAGRMVVDDADRFSEEAHLALLLDAARTKEAAAVLLVARERPEFWPVTLRDLRSRLVAIPQVQLDEPDDALLGGMLTRLCKAKFIKLTDKTCKYLVENMERSFRMAHAVAHALDRLHVNGAKPVSVAIAARALKSLGHGPAGEDEDQAAPNAPVEDA